MLGFSPLEIEALALSLRVALWSVVTSLPVGLWVAWLLARGTFPGKGALNAIVHLPLVLPPVVVGYFLLVLLGREGPLGQVLDRVFGISLPFTWQGAALAAAVMAFPLMVRAMRLSLEAVDWRLEAAARGACRPIDDKRGTKEFRVKVAGVLARRAALKALERARAN